MTRAELQTMQDHGIVIGSHTVNHPVMSKLPLEGQKQEIEDSFDLLDSILGLTEPRTFCYPYGGFHTFTSETEALLEANGCDFSFNVEPRDITQNDLRYRRQEWPRYDCNQFAFGSFRA